MTIYVVEQTRADGQRRDLYVYYRSDFRARKLVAWLQQATWRRTPEDAADMLAEAQGEFPSLRFGVTRVDMTLGEPGGE